MKKNTMMVKVSCKVFLKMMLMILVVGINAFLGSVWKDASNTASRVTDTLKKWDDKGLPATGAWKARELLAHLWWLGPLRSSPPLDPLEACGVPEDVSWWSLVVKTPDTRRLLVCLEEQVAKAEADHDIFTVKLACVVFGLVMSIAFLASLYIVLRFISHDTNMTSQDLLDAAASDGIKKKKKVANLEEAGSFGVTDEKETKPVSPAVDVEVLTLCLSSAQLLCTEEADVPAEGQDVCKKRKKRKNIEKRLVLKTTRRKICLGNGRWSVKSRGSPETQLLIRKKM